MTRYAVYGVTTKYRQLSGSWLQTSCTASDLSNPRDTKQLCVFSFHGNIPLMFANLRLTWGEYFPADWTSQQPNLRPSSGCPCRSPCPRSPLLTKDPHK